VLPLPIAAASLATLQATADAAAQAGDN